MQFFEGDENFSWKVLAVESLVIMLSVFLGFMLNSWRISQVEQSNVDTALRSIAAEMQHNKQEIIENVPRYRAVRDTLSQLVEVKGEETKMKLRDIPLAVGLSIPLLRASAFETARSSGALANVEFELANRLFAYYNQLEFYNNFVNQILNGFINDEFKTTDDWLLVYAALAANGEILSQPRLRNVFNRLVERYDMAKPDIARTDTTQLDSTQTDITKMDSVHTDTTRMKE